MTEGRPRARTPQDRTAAGFSVPVESVPPRVALGAMAMAAAGGLALLSDDLLAQQRWQGGAWASYESGGFG